MSIGLAIIARLTTNFRLIFIDIQQAINRLITSGLYSSIAVIFYTLSI